MDGEPTGARFVQYFDKTRMEITDVAVDPVNSWYVTNGLLAKDLITGILQVGQNRFEPDPSAQVLVAGDLNDPNAPTYAALAHLMNLLPLSVGMELSKQSIRSERLGADQSLTRFGVTAALLVPETNHTVANVFWDFMNSSGIVCADGAFREGRLFENPFYATGYPLTWAYWVTFLVGGVPKRVLVQVFERRVLTYTPDNPPGWRVEAGNVGLHYYQRCYQQVGKIPLTWDTARSEELPYLDAMILTVLELEASHEPLGALLTFPALDHPAWRTDVERRLISLQDCARAMRETTPPPTLSSFHSQLLNGLNIIEQGAAKIRRGLAENNVALIIEGYFDVQHGREALLPALEALSRQSRSWQNEPFAYPIDNGV